MAASFIPWQKELEELFAAQPQHAETLQALARMMGEIDAIGHVPGDTQSGYFRFAWTPEDAWLRVWFAATAARMGFELENDAAGNQWAWVRRGTGAAGETLLLGSHLDSVPGGGAFDGPLGVVSSLIAVRELLDEGWDPPCPVAIVNTHDEEGARFAVACYGSRVLTGMLAAEDGLARTDAEGVSVREALNAFDAELTLVGEEAAGSLALGDFSPEEVEAACAAAKPLDGLAADQALLKSIGAFLELHVEQGFSLGELDTAVAASGSVWPHGRWRVDISGVSNHAGTTPMEYRADPVAAMARMALAVREEAFARDVRATVGRLEVVPNGVNVIASNVRFWIDCRGKDAAAVHELIASLGERAAAGEFAEGMASGVEISIIQESWAPATDFSPWVRSLAAAGAAKALDVPELSVIDTGAGHDAAILQDVDVPCCMLFVRNLTGASHTPAEYAELKDCVSGVIALKGAICKLADAIASGTSLVKEDGR